MQQSPQGRPLWPVAIVLVAMGCFQSGAVFGKALFPLVGPEGATALRITLSALILAALSRPWRGALGRDDIVPVVAYGLALAGLNGFFFIAVQTIPLGIAVAIDFLGPLGVAVAYSRRAIDLVWVAVAAAGILLLLPLGVGAVALDGRGLAFCIGAAACWAAYIVFGRMAGSRMSSGRATALGMMVAATVVLPIGVARAGTGLLSPAVLPLGLLVAVLSSALPNTLEMIAMRHLPARIFGVMMSLEPALGAVLGWIVLGEHLTGRQIMAIAMVILASGGATPTTAKPIPAQDG